MIGTVRADSVDDYLQAEMAKRHIPGLSVAVVQDGKVVKAQGYGFASVELPVPATADTVYDIASLTKQFTATAIASLIQDGKLSADDPVSRYVSGLPHAWKAITVRELLNQTSGLPDYLHSLPGPDLLAGAALKPRTVSQFIAMAAAKPLQFKPGTSFAYSNTNYHLLGLVIEKISGQSYGDFLQARFFGPLGMSATQMNDPFKLVPNRARGYLWDGAAVQNTPIVYSPTIQFGDSGILTTVNDLIKWNAALDGETLLNSASKKLLWTPPALARPASHHYASGWIVDSIHGHRLLWHNGAFFSGYSAAMLKFPEDNLTVIVLSNVLDIPGMTQALPLYALTLGLAQHYLPALADKETSTPTPDPQTAALLKTVSAQIANGTLNKSLFVPSFQAILTPAAVAPVHALLAPLGPITSLTLLEHAPDGSTLYRAIYGKTAVLWTIAVDKDHKITLLSPRAE